MYLNPPFIKKVKPNVDGRDFVIGDLHGCFDELHKLLKFVNFDPTQDRLFSTGDLIDRGPYSSECMKMIQEPWFYPVLGNHEDLLINKARMISSDQGGTMSPEEIDYIESLMPMVPSLYELPLILEVEHLLFGKYYVVHAEILPEHLYGSQGVKYDPIEYGKYLDIMRKNDMGPEIRNFMFAGEGNGIDYSMKQKLLWSRKVIGRFYEKHAEAIQNMNFDFLQNEHIPQELKVFCGHNVVPFPMKIGQQYYLDTGAALGYSAKLKNFDIFTSFGHEFFVLSMIEIDTGTVYGCVTSEFRRGEIVKTEESIYKEGVE